MYKIIVIEDDQTKVVSEHANWKSASWHLDKIIAGKNPDVVLTQSRAGVVKGEVAANSEIVELYDRTF